MCIRDSQKLVDKKSLFSSTLQKIPAPNFIEFYNGSTAIADCTELRLSSAFEHLSGEPKLELIVTVLNVNEGHNAELMPVSYTHLDVYKRQISCRELQPSYMAEKEENKNMAQKNLLLLKHKKADRIFNDQLFTV